MFAGAPDLVSSDTITTFLEAEDVEVELTYFTSGVSNLAVNLFHFDDKLQNLPLKPSDQWSTLGTYTYVCTYIMLFLSRLATPQKS